MKNRKIATTVAIGLAAGLMLFSTGEVNASKTSLLLKHNAYVYDQNGRRSWMPLTLTYDYSKRKSIFKVSLIHKGNQQPISGVKYIKGKKYYRVAKNRYIKASTVTWNYFATTKDGGVPIRKSPTAPASEEDGVIGGQRIKIRGKANGADGYVWYRIGKDEWVSSKYTSIPRKAKGIIPQVDKNSEVERQSSISTSTGNNQNQSQNNAQIITQDKNKHKDDQVTYKGNIADFMDWLVQNPRLTETQKANAKDAAEIIRGQGNVPSWYSTYVNISDSEDAASAMNLAKTLDYYGRTNQIRINKGLPILKVSFKMIAKSIVSVDYQKRGGLEHSGYGSFENLAAGQDPLVGWMKEEAAWKYNVSINPSLADQEFHNDFLPSIYGTNGYKMSGHYSALVRDNLKAMGYAYLVGGTYGYNVAYNGSYNAKDADLSVEEFVSLANQWLARVRN